MRHLLPGRYPSLDRHAADLPDNLFSHIERMRVDRGDAWL